MDMERTLKKKTRKNENYRKVGVPGMDIEKKTTKNVKGEPGMDIEKKTKIIKKWHPDHRTRRGH